MNILVVNDDGIEAPGLLRLAHMAKYFGKVTVVAPNHQCSAMSHRITIRKEMYLKKVNFSVPEVEAYSLSGTPADCVKVGIHHVMSEKPDYVFSGINNGYNTGFDIEYSGTVAAAIDGVMNGVKSIAYSHSMGDRYEITDRYILEITKKIVEREIEKDMIWNVNFPECGMEDLKGILWDRKIAGFQVHDDRFVSVKKEGNTEVIREEGVMIDFRKIDNSTDVGAVMNHYISIGKVKGIVT